MLIQLPAVQKYLTPKLENYLQEKLHTEVTIQSIRLGLPKSLVLEGIYLSDLQRDTLLNIGALSLNVELNKLLNKKIQIDKITLTKGNANIFIGADSTNYDFILNAFGTKPASTDTLIVTPDSSNSPAPWLVTFDDAALALQDIDLKFVDEKKCFIFKYAYRTFGWHYHTNRLQSK